MTMVALVLVLVLALVLVLTISPHAKGKRWRPNAGKRSRLSLSFGHSSAASTHPTEHYSGLPRRSQGRYVLHNAWQCQAKARAISHLGMYAAQTKRPFMNHPAAAAAAAAAAATTAAGVAHGAARAAR